MFESSCSGASRASLRSPCTPTPSSSRDRSGRRQGADHRHPQPGRRGLPRPGRHGRRRVRRPRRSPVRVRVRPGQPRLPSCSRWPTTPSRPRPDLRTPKVPEQALISIPPFRVTGRIHLLPERDLREALSELTGPVHPGDRCDLLVGLGRARPGRRRRWSRSTTAAPRSSPRTARSTPGAAWTVGEGGTGSTSLDAAGRPPTRHPPSRRTLGRPDAARSGRPTPCRRDRATRDGHRRP